VVAAAPPPDDEDAESSPQEPTPLAAQTAAAQAAVAAARPVDAAPANPNAKVYGMQNQNPKLVLKATQESWLQIRDGSDIVFTRVLKPGDTYRVPDKAGVRVRTGNAGGLVVVADGVESAPLGSVGMVLRDVSIDAHGVVKSR
jgi:cytoskeleton protein RodZ